MRCGLQTPRGKKLVVLVSILLLTPMVFAASGSGVSLFFVIDNRPPSTDAGQSKDFTIDNRDVYIEAIQFNRIPAVMPQYSTLNPPRTTLPLKFPGESLSSGTAPIDLGPLSVTARIANPTNNAVMVRLKIREYIDPSGTNHTKMFNGAYSENTYFKTLAPLSSGDMSLEVFPRSNATGQWKVKLEVSQKMGITSLSEKMIASEILTFTVVSGEEPTIEYPSFSNDALGKILMPPSQISLTNTVWYEVYRYINILGEYLGTEGSAGEAYSDYYDGLSSLLQNIRNSATLKVKPKTIGNDTEYDITWFQSIDRSQTFGMDRAVILVSIPEGIASSDLIDSGDAHILDTQGEIKGLLWLINAADKRIWRTSDRGVCPWIPRDLSFRLRTNSIKGKKVQFSLQLQIGPFAGKDLSYDSVDKAPWVYDYSLWRTHPEQMYWYTIAVTDPVTIIDDSHQLTVNRVLDYLLISDAGTLYIPYEAIPVEDVTVTWADAPDTPGIPSGYSLVSSVRVFDTAPYLEALAKSATIKLPYDYSGSEIDRLGIFRWDSSLSEWFSVITEIDDSEMTASAKISVPGIYAVLWSDTDLDAVPDITLEYPAENAYIQQIIPEFCWSDPIAGGWLYQVQIDSSSDFSAPVADEISSEPNMLFTQRFEEGVYYWRVRRIDHVGTASRWTEPLMFTVTSDTTPPVILNLLPAPDEEVANSELIISAQLRDNETDIDPNSIVMILNGDFVDHQFNILEGKVYFIPMGGTLSAGEHTIELQAADTSGNNVSVVWSFTTTCNLLIEISSEEGGQTIPEVGSHIINSNEIEVAFIPQAGYRFLRWSLSPEDAGTLDTPESHNTKLSLRADGAITAHCAKIDLTGDDYVDMEDLASFGAHWLRYDCVSPDWCDGADYDKSGIVNISDVVIFMEHWLY